VKIVLDAYDRGVSWKDARNLVVEDSKDLGWFMAPANVAYAVLGLVYGEGDFGRSVCLAVNCGDDTDCSAATCGAVLGIIMGRSRIPTKWTAPIGESIVTLAVNRFEMFFPETLQELTERVIHCKKIADLENPALMRLTTGATVVDDKTRELLMSSAEAVNNVLAKSSSRLQFDFTFGSVFIQYEPTPVAAVGAQLTLRISAMTRMELDKVWNFDWHLPEGWSVAGGNGQSVYTLVGIGRGVQVTINVGEFHGPVEFDPLYVTYGSRRRPEVIMVPVQCENAVAQPSLGMENRDFFMKYEGVKARFLKENS